LPKKAAKTGKTGKHRNQKCPLGFKWVSEKKNSKNRDRGGVSKGRVFTAPKKGRGWIHQGAYKKGGKKEKGSYWKK